jgi:CspA family cold shock protein
VQQEACNAQHYDTARGRQGVPSQPGSAHAPAGNVQHERHNDMATGKIKSLIPAKGFGFITTDGKTYSDLFFHSSSVVSGSFDTLQVGQSVSFEEESDPRDPSRLRAKNVRLSGGGLYS